MRISIYLQLFFAYYANALNENQTIYLFEKLILKISDNRKITCHLIFKQMIRVLVQVDVLAAYLI